MSRIVRPRCKISIMDITWDATACARCAYSLRGLSDGGRCPECGLEFGPDVLILWGRGGAEIRGRRAPRIFQHVASFFVTGITGIFIFLGRGTLAAPAQDRVVMALIIAMAVFLMVWMWWQNWRLWQGRHGWQVRISAEGYGTRPGRGNIRRRAWKGDEEIDFSRLKNGKYAFMIRDNLVVPARLEIACTEEDAEGFRGKIAELIGRRVGLEK